MEGSFGAQEIHNGLDCPPAEQPDNNTTLNNPPSTHNLDSGTPASEHDNDVKAEAYLGEFQHDGPPLKRRRLTDLNTPQPQRSSSRAVSPPWKKVGVEGPTTFFSDGKRKSARVNTLPLDLHPQTDKRTARANLERADSSVKSKHGGASTAEPSPSIPHQNQNEAKMKHSRTTDNAGTQTPTKSPTTTHTAGIKGSTVDSTVTPSRQSSRRKSQTYKVQSPTTIHKNISPQQKRRPGRPSRSSMIKTEEVENKTTNGWHQDSDDEKKTYATDQNREGEDDGHRRVNYKVEDTVMGPNLKPQRLKLKLRPPAPPRIQHPSLIPPERQCASLRELLDNDDALDGANMTLLTDEEVTREAKIRNRIEVEACTGGLLDPECSSIMKPETEEEPPIQRTHQDFMVAHALYFSKLLKQEHRRHTDSARKLAYNAQIKWKANQPKDKEELQQEREERQTAVIEAAHRQCLHDLTVKWELLRAEVEAWRFDRWKEEQEAQGKETLNRVLEESSKLLESNFNDESLHGSSSEAGGGEDDERSYNSEDNMSVDEEEDEDEADNEVDANPDDQLTAEELRRKYSEAHMDLDRPPDQEDEPQQQQQQQSRLSPKQAGTPISQDVEEDDNTFTKGLDFDDDVIKAKIAQAQKDLSDDNANLSEDESTDMSSEDSEDLDPSDQNDEDEEEEESGEDDNPTLSMLLGGPKAQPNLNIRQDKMGDHMDVDTTVQSMADAESSMPVNVNDFDEEEIEEVSLIPDAAQVQTPSSTSSDNSAPSLTYFEGPEQSLEKHVPNLDITSLPGTASKQAPPTVQSTSADERGLVTQDSMPATPISVDMEKKQIPVLEIPHLLRATLREYQKEGFNWLADRYKHNANGILADEMGLGKTIQTITLLAHLALKYEVWGPHLVVVPTSVILNWEMEFKKFLPGFKILTYYGSQQERKAKRLGWLKDKWNVVITSYQLVVADAPSLKRRNWHYLILDEAHNIKNFRSQRWQTLLTFRSHARLLLTGTPLQNNLEELWSLLFFLVGPDKAEEFLGRQEFSQLFKKPADQILENDQRFLDAEGREQVQKLHQVLRPRLLRRMKADVEKQMPGKYEHVVYCKLSKRQRYLYDGFLSRSQTRETLARGNYLSIINCLMQLRKVCNHPDLFETRPIVTSFAMPRSAIAEYEIKDLLVRRKLLQEDDSQRVSLDIVDLLPGANGPVSALDTIQGARLGALGRLRELVYYQETYHCPKTSLAYDGATTEATLAHMENISRFSVLSDLKQAAYLTSLKSQRRPLYSHSLAERLTIKLKTLPDQPVPARRSHLAGWYSQLSPVMQDMVKSLNKRSELMSDYVKKFSCVTPAVVAPDLYETSLSKPVVQTLRESQKNFADDAFHESRVRLSIAFPDKRLLQYDCGKLQRLDALLRRLKSGGHRALIFTQMTKVLDILEQFLNIHGHRYLRLDGSTKLEQRQILTERFNSDPSILAFILSSRSGGLGINLTGADTVIFYDLDWNPAMDKQCQDRCHRIGQTRDVHIYRFVSEHTIEANILRKSNQKRLLDDVIIQEGDFTTDFLNKQPNPRDMFEDEALRDADAEASAAFDRVLGIGNNAGEDPGKIFEQAEDREDVAAARTAEKEVVKADEEDFAEREAGAGHMQRNQTSITPNARSTPLNHFTAPTHSVAIGQAHPHDSAKPTSTSTSNTHPNPKSTSSPSKASSQSTPLTSKDNSTTTTTTPTNMPPGYERGDDVAPRTDMSSDIFLNKQPVGVDRHIVEFLEWEAKGVVYRPPKQALVAAGAGGLGGGKKRRGKVEEVRVRKKG
ncbi:MAG: hypothetical protein LQ340_006936 [Diploschistes diacapsis]|nr:MAG: hypothetical protein LQ340_006936 [Diploschistes diacapsis]